MVNENLIMSPNWSKTLAQFKVGDCFQYKIYASEKPRVRMVIDRIKKKQGKVFITNSLLGGGFEIKRIM